jgi:GNAT superfamily N-acetyltransferase
VPVWQAGTVNDVKLAGHEDADEVGRILADGFRNDPVLSWVFDGPARDRTLDAFFGFLAREAHVPLGATYLVPGSCACWTPPGTPEWPEERGARFEELLSRTCTPAEMDRLGILDEVTHELRPEEYHWYLGAIATVTEAQGRGLGSMLLHASLPRVDAAGLPAYLESTHPRNVAFYERHGFRVTGAIELPGGPTLTAMRRPPQGDH